MCPISSRVIMVPLPVEKFLENFLHVGFVFHQALAHLNDQHLQPLGLDTGC